MSCGTGTGARLPPGFQPHSTSLSSLTCLISAAKSRSPLLAILDHRAQPVGRQADPGHPLRCRRQAPVWRPGRRMRTITGRWIALRMAGCTGQPGRALAVHATHDIHRMGHAGIELQRRIPGNVAVLATGALEDFLHGVERLQGLSVIGEHVRRIGDETDQDHRPKQPVMTFHLTPPTAARAARAGAARSGQTPRWPPPAPWVAHRFRRYRQVYRCWARYALRPPAFR